MEMLTIGQLSRLAGVTPKAIRFYERRGLLPPPRRLDSRYRAFSLQDLRRLQFIVRAKGLGLGLREIGELLKKATVSCDLFQGDLRFAVARKLEETEARTRELELLRGRLIGLQQALLGRDGLGKEGCSALECSPCPCFEEIS